MTQKLSNLTFVDAPLSIQFQTYLIFVFLYFFFFVFLHFAFVLMIFKMFHTQKLNKNKEN